MLNIQIVYVWLLDTLESLFLVHPVPYQEPWE